MTDYAKPLPRIRPETAPFWEGCKNRELRVQRCSSCGAYRFPPQVMCRHCNSIESHWEKVGGKGTVYSFTIPSRTSPGELPAKGFEYPFAVVLVELADAGGVRIPGNLVDCPLEEIKIGMQVEVLFDDVTDTVTLPKFRPAGAGAPGE